jgi:hypothetical protein
MHYLEPEHPELLALMARAMDPDTPTDELRRILSHPLVEELRADADGDPYIYYDYPGHQVDLPARRVGYLSQLSMAVVRHPNVPRDHLELYARRGDGQHIAGNSNVPPDILEGLANGAYGEQQCMTSAMFVANPAAPASVLERVTQGIVRADILEPVLNHPNVSAAARQAAMFLLGRSDPSEATLQALATAGPDGTPFTPSDHHDTAFAVARHAGTPAAVLADLLEAHPHARFELLAAVAAHPNATAAILRGVVEGINRHLADDRQRHERWLFRPLTSADPAKNPILALRANSVFTDDLPAQLAEFLSIASLSEDQRYRVAADPRTDPTTLTVLAKDFDTRTRILVAANPTTPLSVLDAFAPRAWAELSMRNSDHGIHLGLAANPAAPPDLLRRIYEFNQQAKEPRYARRLADNPNTPRDVREALNASRPKSS